MVSEKFFPATVLQVGDVETVNEFGFDAGVRTVTMGAQNGERIVIQQRINLENESDNLPLFEGEKMLMVGTESEGDMIYSIQEPYRLDGMLFLFLAFVALVIFVAGKKGLFSIIGLILSLVIAIKWIIPQILAGGDPLLVSFVGALTIAAITFYLSHGFKKRTTLAFLSTLFTLVVAFLLSLLVVDWLQLFGTGTEEAISLNFGSNTINLKGLLLGAIVIGTLGVLDDVTVTQIASVNEIHKADPSLSRKELYKRGISVGRDHIASIINTLVLAYMGASFPALLVLVAWPRPFWVNLNSEFLAEEIARTLVGSMTLVIAIPVATLVAAHYYSRRKHP